MASYIDLGNKLDWALSFQRTGKFPIDRSSMFDSYTDAVAYAKGDATDKRKLGGTSYPGQIISVYENSNVQCYIIREDKTLESIGAGTKVVSTWAEATKYATLERVGQLVYLSEKDSENEKGLYVVTGVSTLARIGTTTSGGDLDSKVQELETKIGNIINGSGLKSDGTYTANTGTNYISGATSLTDADSKLDAQIKANTDAITKNKVTNTDNSLTVATADTGTTISVKIKSEGNALKLDPSEGLYVDESVLTPYTGENAISISDKKITLKLNASEKVLIQDTDGLKTNITIQKVDSGSTEPGYASQYKLMAGDTQLGETINIPKDLVVKSGSVKTVKSENTPYEGAAIGDKYIELVLNDESETKIYIPVKDLTDVYKAGDGLELSGENTFKVKIDPSSDTNYLSVGVDGVKLTGVKTAIDASNSKLTVVINSAGLNSEDGTYTANTGTNYISGATSLTDADSKLDAQIKVNTDAITAINSNKLTGVTINTVTGEVSSNVATITLTSNNLAIDESYQSIEVTGSTSVAVGDNISTAFKKVEKHILDIVSGGESGLLHNVTAGDGINVTEVAANSQTISVKLDTVTNSNDNALSNGSNGLYLSNKWECGFYDEA